MRNLSIVITGAVERLNAEAHRLVHEATEAFLTELHKIEGVKTEPAQVISPVKTTVVQPPAPVGGQPGGTAVVTGDKLTTGGEHRDTAGSPPKGPK